MLYRLMISHLLYGVLPLDVIEPPRNARQCSPLLPGGLALEASADASASSIIVYAPPGTLERRYVLAQALRVLKPAGALTALAPKDKGGSRLAAELEAFGCTVGSESRAHHRIVTTIRPDTLIGLDDAIVDGGLREAPALGLYTQPGVFSWDRVDAGTLLLLNHLPTFNGRGADLGCGIGLLATKVLSTNSVNELTLVDIDRRAVEAAKINIQDPRATFLWADIRQGIPTLHDLDFVVMNPPFHDTGLEDQTLGQQFIARASATLKHGGQLWLVANRHLPYEASLRSYFSHVAPIAEENGFKLFKAEK